MRTSRRSTMPSKSPDHGSDRCSSAIGGRGAFALRESPAGCAWARLGARARSTAPTNRTMTVSDTEQLLERSRRRADRLLVGALLGLVLRGGEAVGGAAVDLVLEGKLRGAQLIDQTVDRGERKARILGAVQDQEHALRVRR